MPKRYIVIPEPVVLKDPVTKEILKDKDGGPETWDFKIILNKLMSNPKWADSFQNMRAQDAIETAFEEAVDGVMELAEEDWVKLKEAVETPKTQLMTNMGPQVVPGFGMHASLSRQLLKLVAPIMDAKTERPKAATGPVS